jgi:hypothetical protein
MNSTHSLKLKHQNEKPKVKKDKFFIGKGWTSYSLLKQVLVFILALFGIYSFVFVFILYNGSSFFKERLSQNVANEIKIEAKDNG